jgi:hypothetical protein
MKNGTVFLAFVEQVIAELKDVVLLDYYGSPMPSALDERLTAVLQQLMRETAVHQREFQAAMPHHVRSLFGAYGHRAATVAARTNDGALLKLGLLGTAVANYEIPANRRVAASLVVFYHVARKLELHPIQLFKEIAEFASPEMAEALLTFGRDGHVMLQHYGWQELKTSEGVKYKWG